MLYTIIQNNLLFIALPAEECVTDLMFEKGWRVQVPEASPREVAAIGATIWPINEFYREFLAEDTLDPCDNTDRYYEGSLNDLGASSDADEEEFDEFFIPDQEIDTSETF